MVIISAEKVPGIQGLVMAIYRNWEIPAVIVCNGEIQMYKLVLLE
jgi:hypothetical protein